MNQEKIGRFIAESRKKQGLTQAQLAERLGVTDKTISRWENGNYMPDLSLLQQLSKELDITINELLSGEKIAKENYQEKFEQNVINTIELSQKQIEKNRQTILILGVVISILGLIASFTVFPTQSSWSSIFSILSIGILAISVSFLLKTKKIGTRILTGVLCFVFTLGIMMGLDYWNVVKNDEAPIYRYQTITYADKKVEYLTPFYHVYYLNAGTKNQYTVIDYQKQYQIETIPVSPFNQKKSGIQNLIKNQNSYLGNNSNTSSLIEKLPLSEYGYVFEMNSNTLELTIYYHMTDWYINGIVDELYFQKALLYNSVSIFTLIDNVQSIEYSFSGNHYRITRKQVENYPHYQELKIKGKISQEDFLKYVDYSLNETQFVEQQFQSLFKQN